MSGSPSEEEVNRVMIRRNQRGLGFVGCETFGGVKVVCCVGVEETQTS